MTLRLRTSKPLRRSLRRQLVACVAGVHMILMVAFIYDLVDRQQAFLLDRARERAVHQAELLAASAVPQLVTNDLAGLREVLESLADDRTIVSAAVTEPDGRIIGHTNRELVGHYVSDAVARGVLDTAPAALRIFHSDDNSIHVAAPVLASGRLLGWAWMTGDLSSDNSQVASVRRSGFVYMVIAVLSGVVFAFLLASGITRQLRLLRAGTERLKRNQLDQLVPVITENEVGLVTEAFNSAMVKLAAQQAEVARAREALEAEVVERRRAEKELQDANRAITNANERLREFAYAASHDLQEPLRAVTGYAELLKKRYSGKLDADGQEFLAYMHAGASRMQNLIRALLEYSRAGGRGDEPLEAVDCNAAIRSAVENLATAIETSSAKLKATDLPHVCAHRVAILQLFQNLIGNAIKYAAKEQPLVHVWAEPDGGCWRFAVRDNGIGIAPRDHERIFGIFKRVHGTEYPGTGVGLAICTKLVHRYGGRIWVESELGKGATFWFTLPKAPEPKPAPPLQSADEPAMREA